MTTIPGFAEFAPGRLAGGQPTHEQLEALAAAGVRTVVNLRAPGEDAGYDEAAAARALGLAYVPIPVTGAADLTRAKARQLADALASASRRGAVLVHCASGNRVGALVALASAWEEHLPLADALRLGADAGLASLRAAVTQILA